MDIKVGENIYTAQRVFCIGKNYRAHAMEMNEKIPDSPVIFMKPSSSLLPEGEDIPYHSFSSSFQHEVELVVLIGKKGKNVEISQAAQNISGISLGLDLTLRDIQKQLKEKSMPWERSKAFDDSAPIGKFAEYPGNYDLNDLHFTCSVNGELRQSGYSGNMIFSIPQLISEISKYWQLEPGDLIFTGTPSGIADLFPGDRIDINCKQIGEFHWIIKSE